MRKTRVVLTLVIGIVIGIMASIGVFFLTEGDVAWQEYIEVKVIPNVVLALSTISALCVATMPLLTKIKLTLTSFDRATEDVNTTSQSGKNALKSVQDCMDEIREMMAEVRIIKDDINGAATEIKEKEEIIEKILRIGFGNMPDLVKNGCKRQIAEVGQDGHKED